MNAMVRRKVLDGAIGGDASRIADGALEEAERIADTRATLRCRAAAAREEYDDELREVDALLLRLQGQCRHPATTHFVGGQPGESFDRCDLCDAEL